MQPLDPARLRTAATAPPAPARGGASAPLEAASPASAPAASAGSLDSTASRRAAEPDVSAPREATLPASHAARERHWFLEGVDGFVAYDPKSGEAVHGHPPGARLRHKAPGLDKLRTLSRVAARGVAGEQVTFSAGASSISSASTTNPQGEQRLALTDLPSLSAGSLSGPIALQARHGDLAPASARVLALPTDYDGPIFVTDIDDTLRATKAGALLRGEVQPPLPGARELLEGVAALGVPIVYLSAAPAQLHAVNEAFLKQLPAGILLDHPRYTAENLHPSAEDQAEVQGNYKTEVLAQLQATFPKARLHELGDDRYGDAQAYHRVGEHAYIHNVRPDQRFVPDGFQGTIVDSYHGAFREQLLDRLAEAVAQSASLGGDPSLPSTPRPVVENPEPIEKQPFARRLRHEVSTFMPPMHGAARRVARHVAQRLEMHRRPLELARDLSDKQLAAMPPRGLAVLGDCLLRDLDEKRYGSIDEACTMSQQFVRVLTARGTDAGSIDYLMRRMHRADSAGEVLVGPARLAFTAYMHAPPVQAGDWAGWSRYLDQATATRATKGNHVDPLVDGARAFPKILHDIDHAKSTVNFCVFDFQSDEAGWDYARHLAAAAERGCDVRFLYDPVGSYHKSNGVPTDPGIFQYLKDHGVKVLAQKPDPFPNHVMHRKILVLDGRVGYMGGMNVGDEYRDLWHDVHCRLTGPAVSDLQAVYLRQWQQEGGDLSAAEMRRMFPRLHASASDGTARIIGHEGRSDISIKLAYLRSIDTAAKRIDIADPYLTDPEVIAHLCAAARRGVDVHVVLPKINIHAYEQIAERAHYNEMLSAGVNVYEYGGHPMLHAKVAAFDGKACTIGSSNLDAQSLEANDEVNMFSDDPQVVADLHRDFFAPTIAAAEKIDAHHPGFLGRIVEKAVARASGLL